MRYFSEESESQRGKWNRWEGRWKRYGLSLFAFVFCLGVTVYLSGFFKNGEYAKIVFFNGWILSAFLLILILNFQSTQRRAVRIAHKMTASLHESEARFRAMSDASPLGIFMSDAQGKGVYANEVYERISGLSLLESRDEGWLKAVHPEDREHVFEEWSRVTHQQHSYFSEHRFLHPDGTTFWISMKSTPICEGDKLLGYMSTVEDITQRKTREEVLQATQEQLIQAQKLESLGQLAGGIAHDFNNLLVGIVGYCSILEREFANQPGALKKLAVIRKSSERGAQLTKELLGFARKGQYEKKRFSFNQIIQESTEMLACSLDPSIQVHLKLAPNLWNIEGDSSQALQVIMNLEINAKDAMPEGGGIFVETQNRILEEHDLPKIKKLKPGYYVEVSVRDTGSGIPQDIQNKIFDPFFTTKPTGKGTGLGLAMVYGIMEKHGGWVSFESKAGLGTTFFLYFPAVGIWETDSTDTDASLSPSPISERQEKKELPQQLTLLVADDEPVLHELAHEFFDEKHYVLHHARSGQEAVQVYRDHQKEIQGILMDIIMPGMNGIEAAREILKLDSQAHIIFVSGYTENERIMAIRQQNRNVRFLQKPFGLEQLKEAILF